MPVSPSFFIVLLVPCGGTGVHRAPARVAATCQDGHIWRMTTRYGLEIRAATGAEAPGLAELLAAGGHAVAPRLLADRLDAIRQGAGTALVALEWGPPSGVIVLHWYQTLEAALPVALITTLLVAPEARRRGIGRMLVKAAAQAARVAGCGALELAALPDQTELEAFCRATGFIEAGPRYQRVLRKNATL
ncbi:GNAT family N-acetyltransferase [Acidisoma cladoniae]|uniref:GNAT family N-acetyltransferase n=1 Tax=Acidisoma cladoniae TaxID=3040935 RepID=UPI0025518EE5|nr:GNAT family N-acetyltransferase [Acidisoma sp. PAMC 29798]